MALRFKCTNCGKDLVVSFLKRGETAQCRHCGAEMVVPESATETDEKPTISEPVARSEVAMSEMNTALQSPRKRGSAGRTAAIGAGFLVLGVICQAISTGRTPTTQQEALLPGLITGLAYIMVIILFIIAIVQAIRNRKPK